MNTNNQVDEILLAASELHSQALKIIEEWKLFNLLANYGEVHLTGSAELDLMTWRDIDIEVRSVCMPNRDQAIAIAAFFFKQNGVRKVTAIDYSDGDDMQKLKGYYNGVEYIDEEGKKWKLDIWSVSKANARSDVVTQNVKKKLNSENRKKILELKTHYLNDPRFRSNFFSIDIYEAVLDKGVSDVEGFETFLKTKSKS